jgi:hypothetical protein
MALRDGQEGAVDAAGRRAADDVDPGPAAERAQDVAVDTVAAGQPVELVADAAHPDRQADPAVQHRGEADLLLGVAVGVAQRRVRRHRLPLDLR